MQLNEQNKKELVEIWNSAESKERSVIAVQQYFMSNFNQMPSRSTIYRVIKQLGGKINNKSSSIKL